jgi:transcriptional regulator with XRE-family HTH domain
VSERGASRDRTEARTKLAEHRLSRNLTQRQVAMFAGIPLSSYRRLERGQNQNPPLRWLVNLMHVLALDELGELVEEEWLEFTQLGQYTPRRPPPRETIESRSPA